LPRLSDGDGSSKTGDWFVYAKGNQGVCFLAKLACNSCFRYE